MDTDRLRYFCTIAKTGNLHRAAELLHLSPAALSKAVKVLEGEVSLKLITPSGRGIAITDDGQLFATRAEKLLIEIEGLKSLRNKTKGDEPLRVGSFEVFTTHALASILEGDLGKWDLELQELVPGKIEQALMDRLVDVGITYIPIPRAEVDFLKAATLTMGVYGIEGPLLKTPVLEAPFVVPITPVQGSPTKMVGLDGWPDDRYPRNIRYKVTLMESAFELCRMGKAIGYFPSFVVALHNRKIHPPFKLLPYKENLPLKGPEMQQAVYLVKRKTDMEDRRIKLLAKALRLLVGS